MTTPYLGQVILYGYDWAPKGYATCFGQQMSIQQNAALFSILGTVYGGNGIQTFALPDLRGRSIISQGQGPGLPNYTMGEIGGTENITLLLSNLPPHNHLMNVNNGAANNGVPGPTVALSQGPVISNATVPVYSTNGFNAQMAATELSFTGNNLPMSIIQPYLCLNYSIALSGIFPSRN